MTKQEIEKIEKECQAVVEHFNIETIMFYLDEYSDLEEREVWKNSFIKAYTNLVNAIFNERIEEEDEEEEDEEEDEIFLF